MNLCSFCKNNPSIKTVASPGGDLHICTQCFEVAKNRHGKATTVRKETGLPTPAQIRAVLDDYVIGQEEAKRALAVAVYNHYKRVGLADSGDVKLGKSNIMMIGPTGSGKTLITSTLATSLDVPFATADATSLVSSGGRDIDNILLRLLQNSNNDVKRAEQGIIYIDEVDKLASRYTRQGEPIQQALLKLIEGTVVSLSVDDKKIDVDTNNILFIVGGAFVGLDTIVQMRKDGTGMGLVDGVKMSELVRDITASDIAKFGLIPELVGRLPVMVGLDELDKQALIEVLTKPKNAILKQYQKMFAMDNIELVFDETSLEKIAEKAVLLKTGARGLRTILEESMRDIMYNVPGNNNLTTVTISGDVITKSGGPSFDYNESKPDTKIPSPSPLPTKEKTAFMY